MIVSTLLMPLQAFINVSGGDAAATIIRIDERHRFPGENVADMQHALRREYHRGVAIGVAGTEIVELDSIVTLTGSWR